MLPISVLLWSAEVLPSRVLPRAVWALPIRVLPRATAQPASPVWPPMAGGGGGNARQGDADATELAPNAGRKGPGRPESNIVELATRQWDQFCEAGAGSIFFGSDKSVACTRAVARYIEKCKAKQDCELASKWLQVIDHAMKMGAKWSSRRATGPASKDFLELWNHLLQFCENDPKTPLSNKYMWSLYMGVGE